MPHRIYADNAATTPLLPAAAEAMARWTAPGNPSSLHFEGRAAKAAIDEAREIVSETLGGLFAETIFTGSGTEAANLAIIGAALANPDSARRRVLLGASEHHAVLHTAPVLERLGYRVEIVPCDPYARTETPEVGSDVLLVAAMHANNELGTWNRIAPIAEACRRWGALLFVDAVQTFCVGPWKVEDLGADLVAVSAHKVHGPKGVGALWIRAGTRIEPIIRGGGQERELRAGTENVAAIVGFGAAVRTVREMPFPTDARDALLAALTPEWHRSVPAEIPTLPGHAHIRQPGKDAETQLIRLDRTGVAASSGAACSSGSLEPSHVLLACGWDAAAAREGLRFSFGRFDTAETGRAAARVMAGS